MKRFLLVVLIMVVLTACQPVTVYVTERDIGDGKTIIETATPKPANPPYEYLGDGLYRKIDKELSVVCYWRSYDSLQCFQLTNTLSNIEFVDNLP